MTVEQLVAFIKSEPNNVEFSTVIEVIDQEFEFTPTQFQNGEITNGAGENNGSCKILSFAQRVGLSQQDTLACFGQFYRHDVLDHPDNTDHQNIRNFIRFGWQGVRFSGNALKAK